MTYSLNSTLLKSDLEGKDKIRQLERRMPPETTDPNAYAAYNAALGDLEDRIVKLREKPASERNLFTDLEYMLGGL